MKSKPSQQKSKMCSNWLSYGDCKQRDKCTFIHKDCEKFENNQKCSDPSCDLYHRKMCNNWKKEGKCFKNNCNYLHKTCDKDCDEKVCPFHHKANTKNIEEILDSFKQKCLNCEVCSLLVFLDCGDNLFCEKCAKELINKGKCSHCNTLISDYIC